jgi:hypothetical protein
VSAIVTAAARQANDATTRRTVSGRRPVAPRHQEGITLFKYLNFLVFFHQKTLNNHRTKLDSCSEALRTSGAGARQTDAPRLCGLLEPVTFVSTKDIATKGKGRKVPSESEK